MISLTVEAPGAALGEPQAVAVNRAISMVTPSMSAADSGRRAGKGGAS
ncbi:hypothetical protein [Streptosporangium vulgare]